ncbi:MAG: TonB-dependent siderophore receptor [Pusillimonas sp.]
MSLKKTQAARLASWMSCRALALAAAAPLAVPIAAQAQQAPPAVTINYDIAPGTLQDTLNAFGQQSGILLTYASELVQNTHSPGLKGRYTPKAALDQLLQGTGLRATQERQGIYTLRTAPNISQLGPVTVQGGVQDPTLPIEGFIATRSASLKGGQDILDAPRTINVVTRDQMDAQAVQTLDQALRYVPGVVTESNGIETRSDNLSVRGFAPTTYRDGLEDSWTKVEPFGMERIEVIKGPASVLFGQATPGGLVNMVSKRPTADPRGEFHIQGGNFDRKQAGVDIGGPIDEDARWRYRVVSLIRDSGTQVDYVDDNRRYIAPSLSWHPSAATSLTFFSRYQRDRSGMSFSALPVEGTLLPNPWGQLPANRFTGDPNHNAFHADQYGTGYELQHSFNDNWKVVQNLSYTKADTEFRALFGDGFGSLQPDKRTYLRDVVDQVDWNHSFLVDTRLEGNVPVGATRHGLTLGLDWKQTRSGYDYSGAYYGMPGEVASIDLYDPAYGVEIPDYSLMSTSTSRLRQLGIYAQDQIHAGNWVFSLGGRYDDARTDYDFANLMYGSASQSNHADSAFSWQTGAVYHFGNGLTPYASYATSFEPVNGGDFDGNDFKPQKGKQWEVGIKYQPSGHDSYITLSAYHLTQTNVLTPDLEHSGFRSQTGEVQVKGIELEAKAHVLDGLSLIASYSHQRAEVTRSNTAGDEGRPLANVPRNQASAWLDYQVQQGALAGLSAGFGVRYIGSLFGENGGNYKIPSYTLLDAALRYDLGRLNPRLKDASLMLNATNLTNKTYVRICGGRFACQYGNQRSIMATLAYRW